MPRASSRGRSSTSSSTGVLAEETRDASITRRRRSNSFTSKSRPSTIKSSTNISGDKALSLRRSNRRQPKAKNPPLPPEVSNTANDENENDGNVLMSPTPYHVVAKERGTFSPRTTRSAKKKKRSTSRDSDAGASRTLEFAAEEKEHRR